MKYKFTVGAVFEVEANSKEEAIKKAKDWDGNLEIVPMFD